MSDLPSAVPENVSLLALSLSLLPAPDRDLLKHLAPLTSFDNEILGVITRRWGVAGDATLARLAEDPFILRVRDRRGRYRIRDDMRQALLDSWWGGQPSDAVPPDLAALCDRLAGLLSDKPDTDPAELVGLRLFADPQQALEAWKELYATADNRFDLVRCRFLIGMLGWMASVDPEVDAVREDYQAYVEARSLWTDEWYRTGPFLLPAASSKAFEALLQEDRGRVLELQGSGGYGKTMHVRWLIARRCVPAAARIPCARIDFDAVDPIAATREPYLVLLAMAEQLDRQLPGDAFGMLVRTYAADLVRLYRRAPATMMPARDVRDSPEAQARAAAADKVQRSFAGRLAEIPADKPVVLILDTLEVPLHLPDTPQGPAVKPLMAALAEALKAPCVRLVLSGRYEIPEQITNLFPKPGPPCVLPKFSAGEAWRYLVGKRHIERDDLVAAAVQAADGTPFSLALLADLIEAHPAISAGTIAEYRGAEYAYLIERVVKRISEQPVRWVLRYACVPRRFDYAFVRDVLWPRVREEMSGTGGHDRPGSDDIPREGDEVWAVGDDPGPGEQAVRQVWDQVKRYASGSSWINPDEADPDALRLQAEVIRPLRELLRENEIFSVLHADASDYFLHRVAAETTRNGEISPARLTEYLREAVFHRFQFEGDAASTWWQEQIRAADGPVARRALTGELARGLEYTDRQGQPVPWGHDGTLVSVQTLQQARLEFCIASAELATVQTPLRPEDPVWLDASDALERLQSGPIDTLPAGRVALARAAVALGARQPVASVGDTATALDSPDLSPRERLWLAVLAACRSFATGSPEVDNSLRLAGRLEEEAPDERDVRAVLALFVAQRLRQLGRFDEAIKTCEAAVRDELGNEDDFRLLEAATRSSVGDTEIARSVAAKITASGSALSPMGQVFEARCWRRQQHFTVALSVARDVLASLETREASPLTTAERGMALLETGRVEAALLRIVSARAAFADAVRAFGETGDAESKATCYLQETHMLLDGLRNLRAAGVTLDSAERAAPAGSDVALMAQLTRAELAHRLGDEATAAALINQADLADRRTALPTRVAATSLAGLAFGPPRDRDYFVQQLADSLGQITPPAARLPFLTRATRGRPLTPHSKAAKVLQEKVIPARGWDAELDLLTPADRPILRLRAAALARLAGDPEAARQLLTVAWQETRDKPEPLIAMVEILRLARQLGRADLIGEVGQAALASARSQAGQCPLLAAVAVVEYLEGALAAQLKRTEDPVAACAEAEQWLDHGGLSAEAWRARLAKLNADNGPYETTVSYLQAAAQLYTAAGDVLAAEEVQSRATGSGLGKHVLAAELSFSRGTVKSKIMGGRFRLLRRLGKGYTSSLPADIAGWMQPTGAQPYPPELPDAIVSQWPAFKVAMAELLDTAELTRRLPRAAQRPDLAVRVKDGVLQPLPWELAASKKNRDAPLFTEFRRAYRQSAEVAPDTRLVRMTQAGLKMLGSSLQVDGISGPDTARALRAFESDQDPTAVRAEDPATVQRLHQALLRGARPSVVIVQPAPSEGPRLGFAVERRYDQAGFNAITVDQMHIPVLEVLLRAEPPPVIVHVVGGLVPTAGLTAVDMQAGTGSWGSPDETGLLTSADLDRTLRTVSRDWPAPVVVLDVPAPTGRREVADQLLLRNCFAGDLFALGASRAVVTTGLAGRKAAALVQNELVGGLASGDAIGDVVQRVRRLAPDSGFERFDWSAPFAATALWSNDPSMRLPASRQP